MPKWEPVFYAFFGLVCRFCLPFWFFIPPATSPTSHFGFLMLLGSHSGFLILPFWFFNPPILVF